MKKLEPNTAGLLYSGGLDSTTVLYWLINQKVYVLPFLFNYGQRHDRELTYAQHILDNLWIHGVSMTLPGHIFTGSLLTGQDGCSPIVPNRNMVLISVAAAYCASRGIDRLFIGCNADDAKVFPDCTQSFMQIMNMGLAAAKVSVGVIAPFIHLSKALVVEEARNLRVPITKTYSCYMGKARACGKCLACTTRKAALAK